MDGMPRVDIFPEFHTGVLDIGVNLFLVCDLLEDHAVELPHARESENEDRAVAVEFVIALRKQVGQRQELSLVAGPFDSRLESLGEQRITAIVVEQFGVDMALPFFFRDRPFLGRKKVPQFALFPVGEQAFVTVALRRRNKVARAARLVFQKKSRERIGEIE